MELWDIYDKNKVRTGRTMERNHFNLADDEYHLTVLGVIARPDGRFLITKRVMTKAWAPGWWEVSGGAAQAGEESEEAVQREIKEERETMKRFSSSVSYQIILVISSMAVLFLFTDVVLPSMLKSLDINSDQISGIVLGFRIINGIKNVFLITSLLLVLFAGYVIIRRRQEYLWVFLHRHKLDGWLKTFVTCRLARKLSILLKQGVSIIDSLKILRYQNDDVLVRLLAHHFDETLLAGEDFERSLDMEYFDDRFHSLCLLGLKSDDFPSALQDYIAIVETGVNLQIRKISVIFQVICYAFVAVSLLDHIL